MRVAMLVPVIVFAVMLTRARAAAEAGGKRPPLLPGFAVGFAVLVADQQHRLAAAARQPRPAASSRAGAWWRRSPAIGMKTQLKDLATVGLKPVLLMLGETVFLAVLALALLRWLP